MIAESVKTEPIVEMMDITPRLAREWLKSNSANRNLRQSHVNRLARDMASGAWVYNGEAIKFDTDDRLIDGQHRLTACDESGVPFRTLVIYGLDPIAAQMTLDTGASRKFCDLLKMRGEVNVNALAALAKFGWSYDTDSLQSGRTVPSNADLTQWLEVNPSARESVRKGRIWYDQLPMKNLGAIVGAHYLTSRVSIDDADIFFDRLVAGVGLELGSPIIALRRWIDRLATKRDKPAPIVWHAVTLKALNYWREGRSIEQIRWVRGGALAEGFPRVWEDF